VRRAGVRDCVRSPAGYVIAMNKSTISFLRWQRLIPIFVVLLAVVGCQTPKIDWAGRVGHYTYDQAVLDFGPPDRYAKLTDNTVVAEWLTRRGSAQVYVNYGYWYGYYPPVPTYVDTYSPDRYLRLTFGPDGKLTEWKNLYR
jgi:hypothetical protein